MACFVRVAPARDTVPRGASNLLQRRWKAAIQGEGPVTVEIRSLRLENDHAIASRNVGLMQHAWSPSVKTVISLNARRPITITVGAEGMRAAEYGTWTAVYKTPKRDRSGSYLASWRKVDGDWKIGYEAYVRL